MSHAEEANALPDGADDLRGFHFKRLLSKPLTCVILALEVTVAAVVGAVLVGPAIGAVAAAGALLLGVLIVFAIADSRAEETFFFAGKELDTIRSATAAVATRLREESRE